MKLKHTTQKSANRGIAAHIFREELIGIARKHGRRLYSRKKLESNITEPKKRRRESRRSN